VHRIAAGDASPLVGANNGRFRFVPGAALRHRTTGADQPTGVPGTEIDPATAAAAMSLR